MSELFQSGVRLQKAGRLAEAAQVYTHVLQYDPGNLGAINNLALVLGAMREYARAEALLRQVMQGSPELVTSYVYLSHILCEQERYDEAIACCEAGLARSPDHKDMLNTLVAGYSGARRYEEAVALLGRMIAKRPGYAKGHQLLGELCMKLGRIEEAVRHLLKAGQLDPRDRKSFLEAGECLLIAGRAAEACEQIERVLRVDSYDVRALSLKVLALAELGRTDEERWLADPERLIHWFHVRDIGVTEPEMQTLNRELAAFAREDPAMKKDPSQYATLNSYHSTTNLAEAAHPAIVRLKSFIAEAFARRVRTLGEEDPGHPFVRNAPKRYGIDLWAVRQERSSKMLPHIHADGWLSGVYYAEVPAIVNDPAAGQAGWIKFGTPRMDIRLTREPLTRAIKPEPGLVATFPSYFWHDTIPLPENNDEPRLVFAYDLQPIRD